MDKKIKTTEQLEDRKYYVKLIKSERKNLTGACLATSMSGLLTALFTAGDLYVASQIFMELTKNCQYHKLLVTVLALLPSSLLFLLPLPLILEMGFLTCEFIDDAATSAQFLRENKKVLKKIDSEGKKK